MQAGREASAGSVLGQFHEWSVGTPDILASIEFYERLGFTQAVAREVWPHPYAALTDGRIVIGLHQSPSRAASLTFVLPDVASRCAELERRGFEITYRRTGSEVFHEVGLADPSGQPVVLLEARTYSPADRGPRTSSHCGYFCAMSVPAHTFESAQRFWEPLGYVAAPELETPYPHVRLTSDQLNLIFHRPQMHAGPLVVFGDEDLPRRVERLRDLGFAPRRLRGGAAPADHALLDAPEGTQLLMLGAPI